MTTRQTIVTAIERKGALKPCDACGNKTWLVPSGEGEENGVTASMLLGASLGPILTFAPAICNNCGNTRLFHLDTLLGDNDG